MKILLWLNSYYPAIGGIEVVARQLLGALRARGHECCVITTHRADALPDQTVYEGTPVYRFRLHDALEARDLTTIRRERQRVAELKREFAPAVVHVFGVAALDLFELQTRRVPPAPLVVTLQMEETRLITTAERETVFVQLLEQAAWVTCAARVERERLAQAMPELRPRLSYIYNALEAPGLAPTPLADPPRLACIGRLAREKNFALALGAMARVAGECPAARLLMVGDGPERAALEVRARELELRDAVEFTGWVSPHRIPALLNQTTAVVLPSRSEGLPLVAVQAAQMARPVVASRVGGLPDLVEDGETGLLVPPDDEAALAHALRVVIHDRAAAVRMGAAARARVAARWSVATMVSAYEEVYRRVTSQ